jgi:hypothetical protein
MRKKYTLQKTVVFSDNYAFPKRHFNNQNYIALACAESSDRKPSAHVMTDCSESRRRMKENILSPLRIAHLFPDVYNLFIK